ncbi:MAG: peptide chain release factor N(5)-glutamine methyltransferase [Phycisphaerales bacterium]|nr:peptide chain release factor N(5)-glutamine methyltransferase [Phycisphaerales bacterium]
MSQATEKLWTIGALLQWTSDFFTRNNIDEPRLSAEMLLSHALGCNRMALYTRYEHVPTTEQTTAFRELVKRRRENTPVAYLIGRTSFFSFDLAVSPAVLIPRPDTETLVEQVIRIVRQIPGWETPNILDVGTGSGCIAIALAKSLPGAQLVACDVSPDALTIALANAQSLGVADRIRFLQGDLFAPLAQPPTPGAFHVIAANPPYIATGQLRELMPQVRDHEPTLALDGGPDGLDFYRRIGGEASDFLIAGGLLIVETAFNQTEQVRQLFQANTQLGDLRIVTDAAGHPRCVLARKIGG